LSNLTLVLLAAGNSSRFKFPCKKQWLWSGEFPLWIDVLQKFRKMGDFEKVVVVFAKDEVNIAKKYSQECEIAEGGKSREESLRKALKNIKSEYIMVSDIARSCPQPKVIKTLIKNKDKGDCIVPYIDVWDTVVYKNETLKREKVKLIQTPQLSRREILLKALQQNKNFTDERGAIESINGKIIYIKGDVRQRKITTVCDLKYITCLKPPRKKFFNGIGFDIHPFIGYSGGYYFLNDGGEFSNLLFFKGNGGVLYHAYNIWKSLKIGTKLSFYTFIGTKKYLAVCISGNFFIRIRF